MSYVTPSGAGLVSLWSAAVGVAGEADAGAVRLLLPLCAGGGDPLRSRQRDLAWEAHGLGWPAQVRLPCIWAFSVALSGFQLLCLSISGAREQNLNS